MRRGILFGKRKPGRLHSDSIRLQRHWEELGHVSWNTASAGTAATGSALPAKGPPQPQTCTRAGGCCRGFAGKPSHPNSCTFRGTSPPACSPPFFLLSPPPCERQLHWGTINVPTPGHLRAGERMWWSRWSQTKSQYRHSFHFLYPALERMW